MTQSSVPNGALQPSRHRMHGVNSSCWLSVHDGRGHKTHVYGKLLAAHLTCQMCIQASSHNTAVVPRAWHSDAHAVLHYLLTGCHCLAQSVAASPAVQGGVRQCPLDEGQCLHVLARIAGRVFLCRIQSSHIRSAVRSRQRILPLKIMSSNVINLRDAC